MVLDCRVIKLTLSLSLSLSLSLFIFLFYFFIFLIYLFLPTMSTRIHNPTHSTEPSKLNSKTGQSDVSDG